MSAFHAELLELTLRTAEALGPPPVSRVIVPPAGLAVEKDGSFGAVLLEDGSTGLVYLLLGDTRARLRARDPSALAARGLTALLEGLASEDPGDRALGIAAANALTRHLLDRAGYLPDLATDSFGSLALGPGDHLGMVGFFPPLVRRARDLGIALTVLELKAELAREEPGLTVTLDPARLAGCDAIVCTSTVLLNDSLEAVLAAARGARELVVIGPSAGFAPDPLFARGVTGVGGTWVTDPAGLAARLDAGERWGDTARKSTLRREGWPGVEALVARARAR
jgi:uncharacterized protein (DUF4213/DUF364 family)